MVAGEVNTRAGLALGVRVAARPACPGRERLWSPAAAQGLVQAPVRPPALWPRAPPPGHLAGRGDLKLPGLAPEQGLT